MVKIGDLCTQDRTPVAPGSDLQRRLPYVGLEHVESETGEIVSDDTGDGGESLTFAFDQRHVLYGKLRPYLNKVAIPQFAGRCSTELIPLLPTQGVSRDYLAHLLRRPEIVRAVMQANKGSRMPRTDMKILLGLPAPDISETEQHRIVDILNRANAIRRLRREAAAKAGEIIPALFVHMFGDPATNPMGWPRQSFGKLGELDRGKSRHRPRNDPRLLGGQYPFVQTGDVARSGGVIRRHEATYSDFGLRQSKLWQKGTLCITIAANIANTGILGFDACFPDSVVAFVPGESVTTTYVQGCLDFLRATLERQAPQLAQKNINLKILRDLEFPVPPIKLQKKYDTAVEALRSASLRQDDMSMHTDRFVASLMARLFHHKPEPRAVE